MRVGLDSRNKASFVSYADREVGDMTFKLSLSETVPRGRRLGFAFIGILETKRYLGSSNGGVIHPHGAEIVLVLPFKGVSLGTNGDSQRGVKHFAFLSHTKRTQDCVRPENRSPKLGLPSYALWRIIS